MALHGPEDPGGASIYGQGHPQTRLLPFETISLLAIVRVGLQNDLEALGACMHSVPLNLTARRFRTPTASLGALRFSRRRRRGTWRHC
jgi:hypothetical protein